MDNWDKPGGIPSSPDAGAGVDCQKQTEVRKHQLAGEPPRQEVSEYKLVLHQLNGLEYIIVEICVKCQRRRRRRSREKL